MSKFFKSHLKEVATLSEIILKLSGNNILVHSVSDFPLPTWYGKEVSSSTKDEAPATLSKTEFATHTGFLTTTTPTTGSSYTFPEAPGLLSSLYLLSKSKFDSKDPTNSHVKFDPRNSVHPRVRFFDPTDTNVSKLTLSVLTGLKIESFELDSFGIPVPNLSIPLAEENSFFLQSALPLSHILPASDQICDVAPRFLHSSTKQPVSVSLYDMTINVLRPFASNTAGNPPLALPFAHTDKPVSTFERMFNKFGFSIPTAPQIGTKKIILWSSYRYVHSRSGTRETRIFMLGSFRPVYGTNVTLVETKFPPLLIKI
jgi:hypothetical protein